MGFMKEGTLYCTVPYFGFKAKQMRLRSDGAGDCSAFGRAIPDGFLSVFL